MAGEPKYVEKLTERIHALERQTSNLTQELKTYFYQMEGVQARLDKGVEEDQKHHTSIRVHEEKLLVLIELKTAIADLAALRFELVALQKDVESLTKWKEDQKKEREESTRRRWTFGPPLLSALIAAGVSTGLFFLARWLDNR